MTDKVQKIREEIERLMYGFNLEADIASCEDVETEKFADIKYQLCKKILDYIDEVQKESVSDTQSPVVFYGLTGSVGNTKEEPVSEDLEEVAYKFVMDNFGNPKEPLYKFNQRCFKAGANWQKEQFEKNRLAACDRQTEEEAEIERDFVMGIIENEHRQPTFDDAIKYGMRLQKEQIKEALLSEILPYFMHGGEADEVVAKLDEVLNQKK